MQSNVNLRAALLETNYIIRANPEKFVFLTVVILLKYIIIAGGMFYIFTAFAWTSSSQQIMGYALAAFVVGVLLAIWFACGLTLQSIRAAGGEAWSVGDLFSGGPWMASFIGLSALTFIPANIPILDSYFKIIPDIASFDILPAVFSAWFSALFSFAWYLIVDKNMGCLDAVKHGFNMVRGLILVLTAIHLIKIVVNFILSLFLFHWAWGIVIGVIIYVLTYFFLAILYRERLRDMEAEGGHPLGRVSLLSLSPEEAPWEVNGEEESWEGEH